MMNEKAVRVLDGYFGPAGWSPESIQVDAFQPGIGWYPVSRMTVLDTEELDAARNAGVTVLSVRPRADSLRQADFVVTEFVPMVGLRG